MTDIAYYVPIEGEDPEFDDVVKQAWTAIETSGNPEHLTPALLRQTIAQRMMQYGGKAFQPPITDQPVEDDDGPPPGILTIPPRPQAPYWYEDPLDAAFMDHYILSRLALGSDFIGSLVITGPAGSGKTTSVTKAVQRINQEHGLHLNLLKMDCPTITDPQKWLGRRDIDENGTTFIESDFIKAVRDGWVILLDEITRLHPHLTNTIMALLDGSQALHLSDMNVTIPVHEKTIFIATANIGSQYGGTHRMDWAHRERFPFTLERTFPPREEEIRVLTSQTGVDPDGAATLVDLAIRTRSLFATGDLQSPVSTRTLVAAAWLVASGMNERDALTYTAIPLYDGNANGFASDQSERMIVTGAIEGKTRRDT